MNKLGLYLKVKIQLYRFIRLGYNNMFILYFYYSMIFHEKKKQLKIDVLIRNSNSVMIQLCYRV